MIFVYMLPAVLFSAGAIVAMKLALKDFLPLDIVFLRFIIATITMLLWAFFNKVKLFNIEKKDLIKVGCCGFLLWLYNMLLVVSLKHTAAIRVGALSALIPITTLLLAYYVLKTPIKLKDIIAITMSMLGAIFLINPSYSHINMGDITVLLAVLCFSLYSIINKSLDNYKASNLIFIYFLVSSCLSLPYVSIDSISILTSWQMSAWSLLYLGLCGSAISYLLIQKSVQTYGPSNTNIFMNLVPGVSIVMSVYILGEHISLYSCVCILVIIGAVIVKNISFNNLTNILKTLW